MRSPLPCSLSPPWSGGRTRVRGTRLALAELLNARLLPSVLEAQRLCLISARSTAGAPLEQKQVGTQLPPGMSQQP